MSKNTLSLQERWQQAVSEFIGRFTLPDDATKWKSYYAPIKKQAVNLFKENNTKKKRSIPEDEDQSFVDMLSIFDSKCLDLRKIIEWPVTGKPWSISKEENKSKTNQKSLFRNHLELLPPIPPTMTLTQGIHVSVVDAMRVVRLISVSYLKPRAFKYWAINVLNHLNLLPGAEIHVLFDDYQYMYETPSKNRDTSEWERIVSDLDQELPDTKEWSSFLSNEKNKHQLVNLLVHFILESDIIEKTVDKDNQCYYIHMNKIPIFEYLC